MDFDVGVNIGGYVEVAKIKDSLLSSHTDYISDILLTCRLNASTRSW